MKGYKEIERRIKSFSQRTNLVVSFANERFEFSHRNSPYVSHQNLSVSSGGHHIPGLIVFGDPLQNGTGILLIHNIENLVGGDVITRTIPAHLLPALEWPAIYPKWVYGLVYTSYPDTFSGYDEGEDGKPMFEKYPVVTVEGQIMIDFRPTVNFLGDNYHIGDVVIAMTKEESDALQIAAYEKNLIVHPLNADETDHRWVICTKKEYDDYLTQQIAQNN